MDQQLYFIICHKISIIPPLSQTNFTKGLWNIHKIFNYMSLSSSNHRVKGIVYFKRRLWKLILQICVICIKPKVSRERDQTQEIQETLPLNIFMLYLQT